MESYAVSKIDHIIKSHSGIGVKVLKLQLFACPNISAAVLDKCDIVQFKVPCLMQQLKYLEVTKCQMLQVIEIDAPKLSTFIYGDVGVKISLGDPLQVKDIRLMGYNEADTVCYARTKLPSILPNIESLVVSSPNEMTSTPVVPSKFLHLKFLEIYLKELFASLPSYDFFSLVSFLDASPALETFILHVEQQFERHDSILDGEPTDLRRILHDGHANLQNVTITGFNSTKSMIELTTHILENAPSLKCITLDTANFSGKNHLAMGECSPMMRGGILEARRAFEAARRHIAGKIPSFVEYKFLEPCRHCHFGY
ncbi:hypothetical protein OsJ_16250 [Oryza sativa Japonica Group]|nr:hypothetical protein OsJ_16250 [Oryza sativa Japonica Group]